jgi:hypothetical protein
MRTAQFTTALLTALLMASTGCQKQPAATARTDQQITSDIQAKLQAESALSGQNIQVAVNNGVVTLSGTSANPASRALAGNDAGSVPGVRTVVNNLDVQPDQPQQAAAAATPAPAPAPEQEPSPRERRRHKQERERARQQDERQQTPEVADNTPPPPPAESVDSAPAQAPAPPPQLVQRTVTFPSGTTIPIRITDALSSETAQPNQTFHATLAADLVRDGMIAIPQGTPVLGRVIDARNAARIKGSSLLSLELTRLDLHGHQIPVYTSAFSKEGAGRGKNTAEKAGGGALLGTLIGAIAGGGKGAAIGAIAGAGAGTGINAATHGQQVQIPSETLVNFTLQSPLSVTTSRSAGSSAPDNQPGNEPSLQQRPQQQ